MGESFFTDIQRWSTSSSFSTDWDKRAQAVSAFLPKGLSVLDLGCGQMVFEKYCVEKSCLYFPADLVARDERTIVIDCNTELVSSDLLQDIDLVVMLGVVEYISDFRALLSQFSGNNCSLLFTYSATDFFSKQENENRYLKDGWFNSYSISELDSLFKSSGFEIIRFDVFNFRQCVFLISNNSCRFDPRSLPYSIDLIAQNKLCFPRKKLILAGFFGRGNAGDEALLQCIYETFSKDFDIVVSVDEYGAFQGFWNWYPYSQSRISHQCATSIFFDQCESIAGLIVGGGGLPVGFCANLVFAAKSNGIPSFLVGVDLFEANNDQARMVCADYINMFDFFSYRSVCEDMRLIDLIRCDNFLGADWAIRLPPDLSNDIFDDSQRALLVIREYPQDALADDYFTEIEEVFKVIESQGYRVVLAPFCSEDTRFINECCFDSSYEVVELWSNPRRLKQLILSSGLLVSIGRLHPLIFGAGGQVPMVAIAPHVKGYEGLLSDKIMRICRDFSIPFLRNADELKNTLLKRYSANADFIVSAKSRLDFVVSKIYGKLANG